MLRVLSLTTLYPGPESPGAGLFVRARLQRMGELAEVTVVAPKPLVRVSGGWRISRRSGMEQDGTVRVARPRWLYMPGVEAALPLELAAGLAAPVARLARERRFDVIDAHFGYPAGVAAALLARALGLPFVVTLRGSETAHARSALPRRWLRWTFRRAAAVISVSRPLRDFARGLGADADKCHVVPNGVDAAVFHPRDQAACRRELAMSPGARHIVSAGHVIEAKGHHLAAAQLEMLAAAGHDAHLWVLGGVGHGRDYTPAIRASARGAAQRLHLVGRVEPATLAAYMCGANVVCLASYSEGWPNVVAEALACGTPVVASRVGGVPDMLCEERYGLMVPPRDGEALGAALRAALERSWDGEAISAWGRARSWEQVAADAVKVLSNAVGNAKEKS